MAGWLDLLDSAGVAVEYHNVEDIKRDLAIAFVLEHYGHKPEAGPDGKLHARCIMPDHDDQNPSFDVYGEHLEKWGCFGCGVSGDVMDLVEFFNPDITRFVHRKDKAAELLQQQLSSGWTGPREGVKRRFDQAAGEQLVTSSQSGGSSAAWYYLHADIGERNPRIADVDADIMQMQFYLGTWGQDTVIPYYDRDMNLVAFKRRRPGRHAMAASGADLSDVLYAEWMDDGRSTVLLCEGESDTWAAHFALPEYSVMGIPSGVSSHPTPAHRLSGRDVVIAFDGDDAGRRGVRKWYQALIDNGASSVRIVVMPDDLDLAKAEDIRALVESAQYVPKIPHRISLRPDGLYNVPRSAEAEPEALSNWVLIPHRQLLDTDSGFGAWECTMQPGERNVVITTTDLSNKRSIIEWCARHEGAWYGSDTDCQHLLAFLQSVRPFLAHGYTTRVAGLHENHYVWPGGRIGPDHWIWNPLTRKVPLGSYIELHTEGEWDFTGTLKLLRSLHQTNVMDPILSWLALAPLRSLISPFPTLAILGGSGSGKTTLLEAVLPIISGSNINTNLASTSSYALTALAASTNAFPVWIDEYRPGAHRDALRAVDQIVRDAYDGHASIKGGAGHWSDLGEFRYEAPLIVSGEDAFSETSHLERIVPLYIPREGKNAQALQTVKRLPDQRWAHMWLQILRWGLIKRDVPLTVTPIEIEGLPPRMQYNLGVLQLGWDLLNQYAIEIQGQHLGDPDWSRVISNWTKDAQSNPILDALIWCLGEHTAADFIRRDADHFYIRVENFTKHAREKGDFVLPGGARAVRQYMLESLGGRDVRARGIYEGQVRAVALPAPLLEQG
jgi:hypothetical protein